MFTTVTQRSRSALAVLCLALLTCVTQAHGPALAQAPTAPVSQWIVLRVDEVKVTAKNPDTGNDWDPTPEEQKPGNDCAYLAKGVGMFSRVAAAFFDVLCHADARAGQTAPSKGHPEFPDLALQLFTATNEVYETATAHNTVLQTFKSEFVVPVAAIPSDGLTLNVVDRDGSRVAQIIGSVKLYGRSVKGHRGLLDEADDRAVADASGGSLPVMSVKPDAASSGVDHVDIVVRYVTNRTAGSPAQATATMTKDDVPIVSQPPLGRQIAAGEIVEISVTGNFSGFGPEGRPRMPDVVCSLWCDDEQTVQKETVERNNERQFSNSPFATALTSIAIATLGPGDARQGFVVGKCVTDIARVDGLLRVGINDTHKGARTLGTGQLDFTIKVRAPTADEWKAKKAIQCSAACPCASH